MEIENCIIPHSAFRIPHSAFRNHHCGPLLASE